MFYTLLMQLRELEQLEHRAKSFHVGTSVEKKCVFIKINGAKLNFIGANN